MGSLKQFSSRVLTDRLPPNDISFECDAKPNPPITTGHLLGLGAAVYSQQKGDSVAGQSVHIYYSVQYYVLTPNKL